MFETHRPPQPDKILRVMKMFADDRRPEKIDLGVGVYRAENGTTPVMAAVKAAERRLLEEQHTKGYVALAGDPAFHAAMRGLVLGDDCVPSERLASLATPGGTGAVRQAFELVRMVRPDACVWTPAPTWPNHEAILDTVGLQWRPYRYYRPETGGIDRDGMAEDLGRAKAGDVILLHGCCHNPTGADMTLADWQMITVLAETTGALPMIDLAYQGFGAGIETDVGGLRHLVGNVPEAILAVSASKNFGLYRERVGLLFATAGTPNAAAAVQGSLAWLNRQTYAFPPDHGARVVTEILTTRELRVSWQAELDAMRGRIDQMRQALVVALREETGSDRFGFLGAQRGMFSLVGATQAEVAALRADHGLYMIDDGRINVAGLTPDTVAPAARALAAVLG